MAMPRDSASALAAVICVFPERKPAYTTPMLTTVSLPKTEMAHLAIQILTDRMNGGHKAVVKTELQSTLVIRQSVHQYVSTENEPEYYI